MGNPKQKWTTEEEEALKAGVAKHGAGKWKNIQRDPEFHPHLFSRSNIDLKDKWRNMTVNAGEKSRPSKPKSSTPDVLASCPADNNAMVVFAPVSPSSASAPTPASASGDAKVEDSRTAELETITWPRYQGIIFEAISALDESNGADVAGIINYIQRRHQLPPNFRKQLVTKLRKLVNQEKLEKHVNVYKIAKKEPSLETKTPALEEKDIKPRYIQNAAPKKPCNPLHDAADAATSKIAEAENKSFVAAEAIKEVERVSKMAEEAESMLRLAQEILEKCLREEEVVLRV